MGIEIMLYILSIFFMFLLFAGAFLFTMKDVYERRLIRYNKEIQENGSIINARSLFRMNEGVTKREMLRNLWGFDNPKFELKEEYLGIGNYKETYNALLLCKKWSTILIVLGVLGIIIFCLFNGVEINQTEHSRKFVEA